jgi:hypothetical protein
MWVPGSHFPLRLRVSKRQVPDPPVNVNALDASSQVTDTRRIYYHGARCRSMYQSIQSLILFLLCFVVEYSVNRPNA